MSYDMYDLLKLNILFNFTSIINLKFYLMKTFSFFACTLIMIGVSACSKSDVMDEFAVSAERVTRTASYAGFTDVTTTNYDNGSCIIQGEIVCNQDGEYTFLFAPNATSGVVMNARVGSFETFRGVGGINTIQEKTFSLKAGGTYQCYVEILFTKAGQTGMARLVIDKVNGSYTNSLSGYIDLVVGGNSNIHDSGESTPYHWTCPECGCLNSVSAEYCVACGHEK